MAELYKFKCKNCNKRYKHRQNLYRHVRLKHSDTKNDIKNNTTQIINSNLNICKYCDKVFKHNQSKYRHQKTCKENIVNISNKIYSKSDMEKEMKKLSNILTKKFIKLLKELKIGDNICNNIGNQLINYKN